jgi:hypothetical protein
MRAPLAPVMVVDLHYRSADQYVSLATHPVPFDATAECDALSTRTQCYAATGTFSPIVSFGTPVTRGATMPNAHPLPSGQNIYETPCPVLYAMELIGQK